MIVYSSHLFCASKQEKYINIVMACRKPELYLKSIKYFVKTAYNFLHNFCKINEKYTCILKDGCV